MERPGDNKIGSSLPIIKRLIGAEMIVPNHIQLVTHVKVCIFDWGSQMIELDQKVMRQMILGW